MSTYTQVFYHITFSTKDRRPVLDAAHRTELCQYIWGIVHRNKSHLYRVNMVSDHIHLFTELHPSVSLADFVKDIKLATSLWMRNGGLFPAFDYWQEGYGAFTHSLKDRKNLVEYVKGQEEHHRKVSFKDELRALLIEAGISFDEKYLG